MSVFKIEIPEGWQATDVKIQLKPAQTRGSPQKIPVKPRNAVQPPPIKWICQLCKAGDTDDEYDCCVKCWMRLQHKFTGRNAECQLD